MKINNGFTLVEIAIVLVIIGLFMGTMLKGSELITNAKVKNIENNFNSLARAITIYRENYHQLPGDDDGADRFKSGLDVGDGDGIIEGDFTSTTNTDESRKLWLHLRSANLVDRVSSKSGNYNTAQKQQPQNTFGGLTGISSDSSANGAKGDSMTLFIGFSKIPNDVAITLEAHSDDEDTKTGRIRSNLPNYKNEDAEHNLYFSL